MSEYSVKRLKVEAASCHKDAFYVQMDLAKKNLINLIT